MPKMRSRRARQRVITPPRPRPVMLTVLCTDPRCAASHGDVLFTPPPLPGR
jgi:hypothetical protein